MFFDRCGAWVDGDDIPDDWQGRGGGLADWIVTAEEQLVRDVREIVRSVSVLDACCRAMGALARRSRSAVWAAVLIGLGAVARVTARRKAGAVDEDDIATVRPRREAPFNGTKDVLLAVRSQAMLGVATTSLRVAEDQTETRGARGGAVGYDFMYSNPTRAGGDRPKALAAVERRIDAAWALRAAGLAAEDLELLQAADVGVLRPKAKVTREGVEPAVQKLEPAELAERLGTTESVVRGRIRRARRVLDIALEERGSRSTRPEYCDPVVPPRPRRARPALALVPAPSTRAPAWDPFATPEVAS